MRRISELFSRTSPRDRVENAETSRPSRAPEDSLRLARRPGPPARARRSPAGEFLSAPLPAEDTFVRASERRVAFAPVSTAHIEDFDPEKEVWVWKTVKVRTQTEDGDTRGGKNMPRLSDME